jgi:histidyl-tRNA synthetase
VAALLDGVADVSEGGPADAARWRFVRRRGVAVFQAHGYTEVRPAVIEPEGMAQAAGTREAIAIGPEGKSRAELRADPQASLARLWARNKPDDFARWMAAGTVFDQNAHGAHRVRGWAALTGLVIGAADPAADAEAAILLQSFAGDLSLREGEVTVGTLGDAADLRGYTGALAELLPLRCNNCQAAPDVLRFFTCEDEGCRALAQSAPPLRDFLGVAALKHHEALLAILEAAGFHVTDDPRMAFGQGRYQGTVMELRARDSSGVMIGVGRGGRRDDLLARLGAPPTPAFGLTVGVARAAACLRGDGESYEQACEVFFASRGAGARAWALKSAAAGRALGFRTDVELRDLGWEQQVARAERSRARVVVLAGEAERKKGEVALRDMRAHEFRRIPEETLLTELKRILR